MKKFLKGLVLVGLMLVMLFALTGCGNKLVATKEEEEDGMKYKERTEFTFKKDEVTKIKITYKMENADDAKKMESTMHAAFAMMDSFSDEDVDYEITRKGKKVTMKVEGEATKLISESLGDNKEEIKESLEEQDYKVK